MKEVVVLSGKGGTGKTSLVASLASLLERKVVADCDVDAANLNLLLGGRISDSNEFRAGRKASIMQDICTGCGKCREVCRFGAISGDMVVDTLSCEGCGACHFLCPVNAVSFHESLCGHYYTAETDKGTPLVFAELLPGHENSGKLVSMVRTRAREIAERQGIDLVLIDGPPGIGCPVISSLTGAHLALMVTEPTMAGVHDLGRALDLARHFNVSLALVVNKGDINPSFTGDIVSFCRDRRIDFLGSISYEPMMAEAQRAGKTVLDFAPGSPASVEIRAIFERFTKKLEEL